MVEDVQPRPTQMQPHAPAKGKKHKTASQSKTVDSQGMGILNRCMILCGSSGRGIKRVFFADEGEGKERITVLRSFAISAVHCGERPEADAPRANLRKAVNFMQGAAQAARMSTFKKING